LALTAATLVLVLVILAVKSSVENNLIAAGEPKLHMKTQVRRGARKIGIALSMTNLPSGRSRERNLTATVRVLDSTGAEVAVKTAALSAFGYS